MTPALPRVDSNASVGRQPSVIFHSLPSPKTKRHMNIRVADLMISPVMTATRHQTFGHIKKVLREHNAGCMPVVNSEGEPIGIITARDLLEDRSDDVPISQFMTDNVFTVAQYSDVSLAARMMRNHKIHHAVVTHEKKVVGVISSYDLLQLVEDHRFTMKNAPGQSKQKSGKRRKTEVFDKQ